mgnify:CR=1 FL=1
MKSTTIDIKVPGLGPTTVILAVLTIMLWIMVGVLLINMIGRPSEIDNLWFLWLVMIGMGILTGNHIIWEATGKVRIKISSNRIHIVNLNNIFKEKVNIPIEDFRRIEFRKEEKFVPLSFWGFTNGDILLKFKNGQRRFGKDLNKKDSLDIIHRLQKEIKTYSQ